MTLGSPSSAHPIGEEGYPELKVLHELGKPLPQLEHACSVSLPLYADVVGYEEGEERVHKALSCGYPRFFLHPEIIKLQRFCAGELGIPESERVFVLPSRAVAERLLAFLKQNNVPDSSIVPLKAFQCHVVQTSSEGIGLARTYWQHTGEIVSSRLASKLLKALLECKERAQAIVLEDESDQGSTSQKCTDVHRTLQDRIAKLQGVDASSTFLFPTGMSAIFTAFRSLRSFRRGKAVMFGFPYIDTLKILQRQEWGEGVHFFPESKEDDYRELEEILQNEDVVGIFLEFPGNPLLHCADLPRIKALAADSNTPVVVDDTIGGAFNTKLLSKCLADVVVTSLTKSFSGGCNVMGGSLVIGSSFSEGEKMLRFLRAESEQLLFEDDAKIILQGAEDYEKRQSNMNRTAEYIVNKLQAHPLVESVFYPSLDRNAEVYEAARSENSDGNLYTGFGSLFSFVLKDRTNTQRFYDALLLPKGPSLGANFTLCCLYTLLAHYNEQDFALSCGVDPFLIRISVGLEPPSEIWDCMETAFQACT